ncbi:helix-turn-helix domain-containing protein [Flavobacterium sp. MC2016-06]|uniref:helix-turn-helix domain-containing protein n=1 Tax=Flavobacterium sp. MC2016-06 TaxID=2676308 RepID=UPI0012BA59E9|nr:AraC family transcriptional regulator [Flavobacterium sp. MC2016-06]
MDKSALSRVVFLEIEKESDFPNNFNKLYHKHLYCHNGSITFLFNDQKMVCKSGQFLFWFAESRLSELEFSKNFKATVLLAEKDFLMDNIPDQSWSINAQLHSRVYPIKDIKTKSIKEKILTNFKRLNERFLETEHRFYEEALKLQMQLFILEMWHIFANEYEQRKHSLQTGTLYEQFIQLLQQHCLKHREVQFYSSELNITAKYLNHLCKIHSGSTASEWIQRHAKEHIILLLQNRNLNISEIADQMDFSSRSFFTRYVKKLLNLTPKEFRERLG